MSSLPSPWKSYKCLLVGLRTLATPQPFKTWAMDLIGPITSNSRGTIWILTTMELYTKWVKAIPLKKAIGAAVAIFIKENIICHFKILKIILCDNITPFVNRNISNMLGRYCVKHHRSTSYYPKGNGQAEATNKTLIRILSRVIEENLKG